MKEIPIKIILFPYGEDYDATITQDTVIEEIIEGLIENELLDKISPEGNLIPYRLTINNGEWLDLKKTIGCYDIKENDSIFIMPANLYID